jgi:hypothetical protein
MGRWLRHFNLFLGLLLSAQLSAFAQTADTDEFSEDGDVVALEKELASSIPETPTKNPEPPKAWVLGDPSKDASQSTEAALGEEKPSVAATIAPATGGEVFIPSEESPVLDTNLGTSFVSSDADSEVFVKILRPATGTSSLPATANEQNPGQTAPSMSDEKTKEFKISLVKASPPVERVKSHRSHRKPASTSRR